MMKQFFVAASVATLAASGAFADSSGMRTGGYGQAGCGLGSMVFEKNAKTHQVLAATTNGSFGTQTFGISTGTSNCTGGEVAKIDQERQMFVAANFGTLTEEMAQGKGETLTAFANLMGCNNGSNFGKFTQSNFENVFSKASTPNELLGAVENEMATDAQLAQTCQL